jgi:hypothetical protein
MARSMQQKNSLNNWARTRYLLVQYFLLFLKKYCLYSNTLQLIDLKKSIKLELENTKYKKRNLEDRIDSNSSH